MSKIYRLDAAAITQVIQASRFLFPDVDINNSYT